MWPPLSYGDCIWSLSTLILCFFFLNTLYANNICCCIHSNALQTILIMEANIMNPDLGPYCLKDMRCT